MTVKCECCGHPISLKPRRVCYDCGIPMSNHHRWSLEVREGISTPVHKSCEHPDSPYDLDFCKANNLPPYNGVGSIAKCEEYARQYHERMALAAGTATG